MTQNILSIIEAGPKGALPEAYHNLSVDEMRRRVLAVKERLGNRLFIPAHHYQKDEVVEFADATGDSLQLAQMCQQNKEAEYIVFCGVHFMAETADILTEPNQVVLLPDLRAGCSLADMANINETERCWQQLIERFGESIIPLTYVNSTAAIKAFVGRHGGATVTSSNAEKMIRWAFSEKERILFLPDQHLGRNISHDLGISLEEMAVWDPIKEELIATVPDDEIKVILWKGHCAVHENFTVANVEAVRKEHPNMKVLVHPECPYETVSIADYSGSTSYIIEVIEGAEAGSEWAIGTEMNLVKRLAKEHPDKKIISLNPNLCPCMTMNRIDLPHLLCSLESIEQGVYKHPIRVEKAQAEEAIAALDKMLENV